MAKLTDESITCEECGQTFIGINGLTEWTFHRALRHATETEKTPTAILDGDYWHIVRIRNKTKQ